MLNVKNSPSFCCFVYGFLSVLVFIILAKLHACFCCVFIDWGFSMEENIILSASLDNIPYAVTFVKEYLRCIGIDGLDKFAIVVEEIFANIAHYAYEDIKRDVEIICDYEKKSNELTITFVDGGVEYNPLNTPEPDITLPLEKRKIGGLGVFIVKKFMDKLCYKRKDNKNILTLIKKI